MWRLYASVNYVIIGSDKVLSATVIIKANIIWETRFLGVTKQGPVLFVVCRYPTMDKQGCCIQIRAVLALEQNRWLNWGGGVAVQEQLK